MDQRGDRPALAWLSALPASGELDAYLYRDEIDRPGSNDRGLAEWSVLKTRELGEDVRTIRRLVHIAYKRGLDSGSLQRSSKIPADAIRPRAARTKTALDAGCTSH